PDRRVSQGRHRSRTDLARRHAALGEHAVVPGRRPVGRGPPAYEELGQRGFLVSESGKWRVSDEHTALTDAAVADDICDRLWELIAEARRAGLSRSEL